MAKLGINLRNLQPIVQKSYQLFGKHLVCIFTYIKKVNTSNDIITENEKLCDDI